MPVEWESYDAVVALIARLKTIQGPPTYHTNLEQRVYDRLTVPTDERAVLPYACVVTVDERPVYETANSGALRLVWELRVFGFVAETTLDGPNGDSHRKMLRLHDDMLKAVMADTTLGGAVDDLVPVGRPRAAGVNPRYAEVGLGLRVHRWVGPDGEWGPEVGV